MGIRWKENTSPKGITSIFSNSVQKNKVQLIQYEEYIIMHLNVNRVLIFYYENIHIMQLKYFHFNQLFFQYYIIS